MSPSRTYGLIGIGVGAFNLALAALLDDAGYADALFFERQPNPSWHPGMLLESSELQVHHLKDLVTPVDPTSRFTFLNYLRQRGILYQFINRRGGAVSRNQFQHYFRWVAEQLPTTRFGAAVDSVHFDGEVFRVMVAGTEYRARHIAVATGLTETVPECVRPYLGERVFHAHGYVDRRAALADARIAVIGGGQSGAEVVLDVMRGVPHRELSWYGRRLAFFQLEDNSFINDLYTPGFIDVFRQAADDKKRELSDRLRMSSDGISQNLLDDIYRLAFERRFFADASYRYDFRAGQELVGMEHHSGGYVLTMKSWLDDKLWTVEVDAVALATGFGPAAWETLRDVLGPAATEHPVGRNFEVQWAHQHTNHIFVQNGSPASVGLADPNLSVAAWRAAMIVNRVVGREVHSSTPDTALVEFC